MNERPTPPHDCEIEKAVLGSILIDYKSAVLARVGIRLAPQDFYGLAHNLIFEAMLNLDKKGFNPDILLLIQELKQIGKLEQVGGEKYIKEIIDTVPNSANIEYYTQVVRNYSLKRSLIKIASTMAVGAYDDMIDPHKVIKESIENLSAL